MGQHGALATRAVGVVTAGAVWGLILNFFPVSPSPVNDPCLACLTRTSRAPEVTAMSRLRDDGLFLLSHWELGEYRRNHEN